MTLEKLASLPIGTIVRLDDEEGEIVQAGKVVHIMWPKCTSIIYTDSVKWQWLVKFFEEEKSWES